MSRVNVFNVVCVVAVETSLSLDDVRTGLPWFLVRWFDRLAGGRFKVDDVVVVVPSSGATASVSDGCARGVGDRG